MRLDVASPSLFMGGRGTTHGGHTQTHAHRRHSKMCIASALSVRAPLVGARRAQGTAPTFET